MCNVLGSVIKKARRKGVKVETMKLQPINDGVNGSDGMSKMKLCMK